MANYNATNSLSPMMFKKHTKRDKEGTRSERYRSKSMEHVHISDHDTPTPRTLLSSKKARPFTVSTEKWKEVDKLKAVAPAVACILPSLAMDFVASSLLAVGAIPLITEGT